MEKRNEKIQNQKIGKNLLDTVIYIIALIISFGIGYYYKNVKTPELAATFSKFNNPKSSKNITVSITDKNELLLIDKETQTIDIYQDSVGILIFKAYASKLVTSTSTK